MDQAVNLKSSAERRHDLDALRAAAMLLGIVYHAALSFAEGMPWMVQDERQTGAMYFFQAAVHGFRMPLFFLVSGFFTALLWRKRGVKALVSNRAKRIMLPLALGMVTIIPLLNFTVVMAIQSGMEKASKASPAGPKVEDLWTASAAGDVATLERLAATGADLNQRNTKLGTTPLTMAALHGRTNAVAWLLGRGADPRLTNADQGTPMHAAAFLGRAEVVRLLVEAGADPKALDGYKATPSQSAQAEWGMTVGIAGFLGITLDREEVETGRKEIVQMLGSIAAPAAGEAKSAGPNQASKILQGLIHIPLFGVLWFLWFLTILLPAFLVYVAIANLVGWRNVSRRFLLSPWGLGLMVVATLVPQWFMGVQGLGFGPDTSMGIVPMPHVYLYYLIFFLFGALYYDCGDSEARLGRRWRWTLPISLLVLLPLGLEFSTGKYGFRESLLPAAHHHAASVVLQALYTWAMVLGSMGLFHHLMRRENPKVRYVSDSAYWLYLGHLPLVLALQLLVRDWQIPSVAKLVLISVATTGVLLVIYEYAIRYTWVGALLNGRRRREPKGGPVADAVRGV